MDHNGRVMVNNSRAYGHFNLVDHPGFSVGEATKFALSDPHHDIQSAVSYSRIEPVELSAGDTTFFVFQRGKKRQLDT